MTEATPRSLEALSSIRTIAIKEIVDFLRDWRTLLAVLLVPLLLFPLIFGLLPIFLQGEATELQQKRLSVVIEVEEGGEVPDELARILSESDLDTIDAVLTNLNGKSLSEPGGIASDRLRAGLDSGEEHCILRLVQTETNATESWNYAIISDSTHEFSREARARTLEAVLEWEDGIVNATLGAHGLERQEAIDPIHWDGEQAEADISSEGERAAFGFSLIIPLVVALWTASSAIQPAIDMTAGERERGTLEALLCTPVERRDLLMGKWFAVATIAMVSVLLQVAGLLIAIEFIAAGFVTLPTIPITGWLLFVLSVLMFAIFTVAIELAAAIRARSVKEAGSTLTPMIILFIGPTLFSQFVNLEGIEAWWFTLPIFNVCLGMREALVGTLDPLHIVLWSSTSLLYATLAVIWASSQFNREDLVEAIS